MMRCDFLRLVSLLGFCWLVCIAGGDAPAGERPPEWRANWITCDDAGGPNAWLCFRRTVNVREVPATVLGRIACDSKYWLWVNGKLVVFEGQLKRGPNPRDTYYDQLDLAPSLRVGRNQIAVLVWYFGKQGFSHLDSGRAGLCAEFDLPGESIGTDDRWKSRRHPAFGTAGDPQPNWRLPESNLRFDARRDLVDWQSAEFDDDDWPTAIEVGPPPAGPWNRLVERPIPLFRASELREYENRGSFPQVSTGEPIVARLPYNAQVTPCLELDADAGQTIDMRTDNYHDYGIRGEYVTKAGPQSYESLGWMNGHEVVYRIPAGVRIRSLRYRESGYDCDLQGAFTCNDSRLNAIWTKAQRTLYVNMRDAYFDCPCRERAQWWGDITLDLQQAFYALDRRSDRLGRKAMIELVDWQRPDGTLFSPIPAGNWDQELPTQMLASVGRCGFWEYYRHTADRSAIERVYPAVGKYLRLWQLGDDDLVLHRPGGWTWYDWGDQIDVPLLDNAWYYLALEGLEEMAKLLGDTPTQETCRTQRERLAAAFQREFWSGERGYRSPANSGPTDDRGNALAVIAGLARPEDFPVLVRILTTENHASPYMEKYVLEALLIMGEQEAALDRMLRRYGPMIDSPNTTLWENWEVGSKGIASGTYNHAWSGGPLTLLSQYVAGIDPLVPGYARIAVRPRLGRLTNVAARVPTPRGMLEVTHERTHDTFTTRVVVPATARALLQLPGSPGTTLTHNEAPLLVGHADGIEVKYSEADREFVIDCPPGEHTFVLRNRAQSP